MIFFVIFVNKRYGRYTSWSISHDIDTTTSP